MNKIINSVFVVSFLIGFLQIGYSQVSLLENTKLTDDGLYFEGTKGINYHFGKRITPHGSCIDVVNGYIYVTWYKGGMDKRNLMVSRKTITGGTWKTIEFPDQHIGYRGDATKGDSHNVATIKICTIDNTVHLVYDMHAYDEANFPNHSFNYRVSNSGAAVVPDNEWTIDLFNVKRNYLKSGTNYEKATYPTFSRFDSGVLFLEWRLGGSGNGNQSYAFYDGVSWSETIKFNNGNQPVYEEKYSIYGSFQVVNNELKIGFSIRYRDYETNPDYAYNSGLFYGYANFSNGTYNWFNQNETSLSLPVQSPKPLKIGEPTDLGLGNSITSAPSWTVTANNAIHFLTRVSGNYAHYYKSSTDLDFSHVQIPYSGDLIPYGDRVYLVGLRNNRPAIYSTPEGLNDWREDYYDASTTYRHGNVFIKNDHIFFYKMRVGRGEAQPIYLSVFKIDSELSVKKKTKENIKIYPNPATDTLTIKKVGLNAEYKVLNLNGAVVNKGVLEQFDTSVDIKNLNSGMYMIKITSNNNVFTKPFIKR